MSNCKLDHSLEDVRHKLSEQSSFLPSDLVKQISDFLTNDLSQQQLNELFHLLKKYDLATKEVQQDRNDKIMNMLK